MSNCRFPISNWVRGVRESLPPKDLWISGAVAKLSVSFRPDASGFRNFPFRSVLFRLVPGSSVECGFRIWEFGGGTVCSQTVLLETRTEHSLTSKLWHPQVQA